MLFTLTRQLRVAHIASTSRMLRRSSKQPIVETKIKKSDDDEHFLTISISTIFQFQNYFSVFIILIFDNSQNATLLRLIGFRPLQIMKLSLLVCYIEYIETIH